MLKILGIVVVIHSLICACVQGSPKVHSDSTLCPDICPAIYAPVCGREGNTYTQFDSDCMLESKNCLKKLNGFEALKKVDIEWCKTELIENLEAVYGNFDVKKPECFRPCPYIYDPVCVSNGKYRAVVSSQCTLDTYNCILRNNETKSLPLKTLRKGTCLIKN